MIWFFTLHYQTFNWILFWVGLVTTKSLVKLSKKWPEIMTPHPVQNSRQKSAAERNVRNADETIRDQRGPTSLNPAKKVKEIAFLKTSLGEKREAVSQRDKVTSLRSRQECLLGSGSLRQSRSITGYFLACVSLPFFFLFSFSVILQPWIFQVNDSWLIVKIFG